MKRERITREELMERLFHDDYENLKGKKLRMTRVRVPGKGVTAAVLRQQMAVVLAALPAVMVTGAKLVL